MTRLTALVICRDEAPRIGACLDSLAFSDEILVIDSGSTDGTLEIARARGARVVERAFKSQNDQKEFGRGEARGEWLLNLDADEVASPELAREVRELLAGDSASRADGYLIPFRNYFRSAWVRRCGYYPDPHLRLVRRDRARWDASSPVHDRVRVEGRVGSLEGHIDHYSFDSLDDFLGKSRRYAEAFAVAAHARGQRAGALTIATHTLWRFFRAYVLQLGFLEGSLGVTVSLLQASEVFQKYARLWEMGRFEKEGGACER